MKRMKNLLLSMVLASTAIGSLGANIPAELSGVAEPLQPGIMDSKYRHVTSGISGSLIGIGFAVGMLGRLDQTQDIESRLTTALFVGLLAGTTFGVGIHALEKVLCGPQKWFDFAKTTLNELKNGALLKEINFTAAELECEDLKLQTIDALLRRAYPVGNFPYVELQKSFDNAYGTCLFLDKLFARLTETKDLSDKKAQRRLAECREELIRVFNELAYRNDAIRRNPEYQEQVKNARHMQSGIRKLFSSGV